MMPTKKEIQRFKQSIKVAGYTRVTQEERDLITNLRRNGYRIKDIASLVKRSIAAVNSIIHTTKVKNDNGDMWLE